eukprot:3072535-Prymnesium_polylepis.1
MRQRNTQLSSAEEAAVKSVLAWAEAETGATADPAAKGRKQKGTPEISPECCTQVPAALGPPRRGDPAGPSALGRPRHTDPRG